MLDAEKISIDKITKALGNLPIKVLGFRKHSKASETYVDVSFDLGETDWWVGSIPIEYRRTGTFASDEFEIAKLIKKTYESFEKDRLDKWIKEQNSFWDKSNKAVTRPFFDAMLDFNWKCIHCQMPKNPNWARRFQDIKEFGYSTATHTNMYCKNCKGNTTHVMLLPLPKTTETGYETWSPKLRNTIVSTLNNFDEYESRQAHSLLPDHKFPEIRWDSKTRQENPDNMCEDEIKKKFQLISNQRNQQKREVCRQCFQTGMRGKLFGINYFYQGDENWNSKLPKTGVGAEKGCVGCGWYDMGKWRVELNKKINPTTR